MSSCDLPLKVAGAPGRILELRDMPACVNSTIPTFSWHMLAWKIPYIKSDYMLLCATKTYVWLSFFSSSEKQYFAAFGSSLFLLFFLTISDWLDLDQRYPMSDNPHLKCLACKSWHLWIKGHDGICQHQGVVTNAIMRNTIFCTYSGFSGTWEYCKL